MKKMYDDQEVDSLEHMKRIMNNQNRTNNSRPLDEPAYQISQENSANFASSFGAGGMIPQVVDPDFRPPTTFSSATSLSHNIHDHAMSPSNSYSQQITLHPPNIGAFMGDVSSIPLPNDVENQNATSNNYSSSTSDLSNNAIPSSSGYSQSGYSKSVLNTPNIETNDGLNQPSDTQNVVLPAFSLSNTATTFSDIAKKSSSLTGFSTTITQSTLNEYGPPNSGNVDYLTPSTSKQPNTTIPAIQPSPFSSAGPASSTTTLRYDASDSISSAPVKEVPVYRIVATSTEPSSTLDTPLYSPPPATSPPLDKIDVPAASTSVTQEAPRPHSSAKVPKKAPNVDIFNNLTMIELQARYRHCESELKSNNKRRFEIERILNNMTRQAHGKNIEMDPFFRQNKDQQEKCDRLGREINDRMKKIADKLLTKFDYRIHKDCNPPTQSKRAKMSTATPSPMTKTLSRDDSSDFRPPLKKEDRLKNLLLHLNDTKTWCKSCEEHFESLNDFCNHLHHRDHQRNCPKTKATPWETSKDPIDLRKTYDMIKSICGKVSNETNMDFTPIEFDKILHPNMPDKEKIIKSKSLERERGNLKKDDPLFEVKGFDFLIPINGFYCKLCNTALCDNVEVEQHLKSYGHNYKHINSVALQPKTEQTFRAALEKSRRDQFPPEPVQEKQKSPKKHASTSSTAAPKYKKATSHIVDEHEIAADKFPKRITPTPSAIKSSIEARNNHEDESEQPETQVARRILDESSESEIEIEPAPKQDSIRRRIPDIVPINESRNQPAALKRLKQSQTKTVKEPSSKGPTKESERADKTTSQVTIDGEIESEMELETDQPVKRRTRAPIDLLSVSSDDEKVDGPAGDSSQMCEFHVDKGDSRSPFPELSLCVTGNIHSELLYDPRLAQSCKVVMKRESLDKYKDMLMDEATLWTRVRALMAKKEPDHVREEIGKATTTVPTFFSVSGQDIPVDLEREPDNSNKDQNNREKDKDRTSSESPEPKGNLAFLERFFCN